MDIINITLAPAFYFFTIAVWYKNAEDGVKNFWFGTLFLFVYCIAKFGNVIAIGYFVTMSSLAILALSYIRTAENPVSVSEEDKKVNGTKTILHVLGLFLGVTVAFVAPTEAQNKAVKSSLLNGDNQWMSVFILLCILIPVIFVSSVLVLSQNDSKRGDS